MDENTNTTTQPKKSMMNSYIIGGVVLVLLIGGGALFMNANKNNQAATPTPTIEENMQVEPTVDTGTNAAMEGSVKTFTVTGKSFSFAPNEIKVKKGDKVKIVFNNTGGMHDFIIDEFDVKTDVIKSGETATAEFTADKAGTFEFYCGVANHRAMGMTGTLIVE